jgi:hypothetical protein
VAGYLWTSPGTIRGVLHRDSFDFDPPQFVGGWQDRRRMLSARDVQTLKAKLFKPFRFRPKMRP